MKRVIFVLLLLGLFSIPSYSCAEISAPSYTLNTNYYLTAGKMVTGDFNSDGKLDLAVTDFSENRVAILTGNGQGGFASPTYISAGERHQYIVSADFNRDSKLDLATVNEIVPLSSPGYISVLLGYGTGSFSTEKTFPVGSRPLEVKVGDLNNDCKSDLISINQFSDNVSVLLGEGNWSFSTATNFTTQFCFSPQSLDVGDFNGDGNPDVVTGCGNEIAVLIGEGTGLLGLPTNYIAGQCPLWLDTGDFNGDGKLDLIVANCGTDYLTFMIGKGDGSFQEEGKITIGQYSSRVVNIYDLNQDGNLDIVAVRQFNGGGMNAVYAIIGKGDGTFESPITVYTNSSNYVVNIYTAIGDFNLDGRPDIAVAEDDFYYINYPEVTNKISIFLADYDTCLDDDSDGLCNIVETNTGIFNNPNDTGTDPNNADSDNDGLNDGFEMWPLGTNPTLTDTNDNGISDTDEDSDGDGITNAEEVQCNSDPTDICSKCARRPNALHWLMLLLEE